MSKQIVLLDGDFVVESDSRGWTLITRYMGHTREGESVIKEKRTYHQSFEKVLRKVVDNSIKKCESIEEVIKLLGNFNKEITKTIELFNDLDLSESANAIESKFKNNEIK